MFGTLIDCFLGRAVRRARDCTQVPESIHRRGDPCIIVFGTE
jgi:hypothetical protein